MSSKAFQNSKNLNGIVSVLQFGAVGDGSTNDTDAIQAAINYVAAIPFSGGTVTFPSGGVFRFTALEFPASTSGNTNGGVVLDGNGCTLVKTTASGVGILVQGAAGLTPGLRRENSAIRNINFAVSLSQTSGQYVKTLNSSHVIIEGCTFASAWSAISIVDCFDVKLSKLYIRNSQSSDISISGLSAGSTVEVIISDVVGEGVFGNTTKTGIVIDSGVSGVYVSNSDFTQGALGIQVTNSRGILTGRDRPEFLFFTTVLADSNMNFGWAFSGYCEGIYMTQCWGTSAENVGFAIANGTGFYMNGCIAANNGQDGVSIVGTVSEVHINGGVFCNNARNAPNTYRGINVGANVSNFSIKNARCGNVTTTAFSGLNSVGIYVNTGSSNNYQILGNDCTNNVVAPLVNLGTGLNKQIANNIGFNPIGYISPNPTLPASGVAYTNDIGIDANVYISGGTVSNIETNFKGTGWVSIGPTTGNVYVPANVAIRVTYTVAPTWRWFFN